MNIPNKTFMLVMSPKDFWENSIDKKFDYHCKNGYVYILKGDETPEFFNQKLSDTEKERDYWKHLAGHRLKGVMYWKNKYEVLFGKSPVTSLFKEMFVSKNKLMDKIKKDYGFHGKSIEIPFGTRHKQDKPK